MLIFVYLQHIETQWDNCYDVTLKTKPVFLHILLDLEHTIGVKNSFSKWERRGSNSPCGRSTISEPEIQAVTAELCMLRGVCTHTHAHTPTHTYHPTLPHTGKNQQEGQMIFVILIQLSVLMIIFCVLNTFLKNVCV